MSFTSPKTVKFGLRAERNTGHAGAPCQGYYHLVEYTAKDKTVKINHPTMLEVLKRALKELPPHGSTFDVEVTVRVVKAAKPSKKLCHNEWPAHGCTHAKQKRSKRGARKGRS